MSEYVSEQELSEALDKESRAWLEGALRRLRGDSKDFPAAAKATLAIINRCRQNNGLGPLALPEGYDD